MNESSITIRWEKNPDDGSTDISVNGNINGYPHFRETFLSLDNIASLYYVDDKKTSAESAGKSATIAFLSHLISIIRKSNKINGHIITEQEYNLKFPFTDLITIRRFAQIADLKIDEQKFRNLREFRMYFGKLIREKVRKENW